ncbi:Hypothetical predicted protein [Paramuricea clavata]|uniref:carbonic anhydrase n=1 Tax=Paramuricea clavata TaxID=317549 RepID=A0A7D9HEZ9_PARCT|nr:Hypothetical predicted protein [Paramuricea clavata]
MHIYIGLLSCLVCICAGQNYSNWDYSDQGANWVTKFKLCAGTKQSPIDIKAPTCDEGLNNSITFTNYDKTGSSKFTFENNGHSLVLKAPGPDAKVTLGSLGTFNFHQLHFHWGKDDTKGSEHLHDGKVFPAEMHLVHINSKYSTFQEAQQNADGLAVFGVFIKVGQAENTAFNFLSSSPSLIYEGTKVNVTQFAINTLLPTDQTIFYRYKGSLTSPTCDEIVTWTVFDQPISLSASQLAQFRIVKDNHNKTLVDNFRVVQNLNNRTITYWSEEKCGSGAVALGASIFSALFSLLLFALL